MRERYTFRLLADAAEARLPPALGSRRGLARVVLADAGSSAFEQVRAALLDATAAKVPLLASWNVIRTYTDSELAAADLLLLTPTVTFEPAGEECGTRYDETSTCGPCGAGGRIAGYLHIKPGSIPLRASIAETIAGELVISRVLANRLASHGLHGFATAPVVDCAGDPVDAWVRPAFDEATLESTSATRWGHDPLATQPPVPPCPLGHIRGINLLSELRVDASALTGADVMLTTQYVGVRAGLLRPRRLIVLSAAAFRALAAAGPGSWRVEVVHVDQG